MSFNCGRSNSSWKVSFQPGFSTGRAGASAPAATPMARIQHTQFTYAILFFIATSFQG
jgi:hypothetical protein